MKRLLILIALIFAATAGGNSLQSSAANSSHRESAVIVFAEPVRLLNVNLQGEYMFVHDDELMARGDACTYVYKLEEGKPDELVVSFHCMPALRQQVATFTVRTVMTSRELMLYEVREYQFAGSSEAHLVPSTLDIQATNAIVDLVGYSPGIPVRSIWANEPVIIPRGQPARRGN
jgi:hypothetical protein